MEFCKCAYHKAIYRNEVVVCKNCGKPIECEFSYLPGEKPHQAEAIVIDYVVCKRHAEQAHDNIPTRH